MNKTTFSIVTLIIFMMVTLPVNMNAALCGNESDAAFLPPPPRLNGVASIHSITLRQLIADGGNYSFKSAGQINQFFSLIELSEATGPDYNELQKSLNGAIVYLEQARSVYLQLKSLAAETPYNQEVISKLLSFDYDSFQQGSGLLPDVFEKVKTYLAAGNVTGVYNEFYSYTGGILELLYILKKDIDLEIFPDISNAWNVNLKYTEFKFFGQFVAQVFYKIK